MATASANVTSTGTLVATPATVVGIHYRGTATGGSIILKDDGAGGTVKLTIHTGAAAATSGSFPIGGGGIVFATDVHATLANCDSATVVYL